MTSHYIFLLIILKYNKTHHNLFVYLIFLKKLETKLTCTLIHIYQVASILFLSFKSICFLYNALKRTE